MLSSTHYTSEALNDMACRIVIFSIFIGIARAGIVKAPIANSPPSGQNIVFKGYSPDASDIENRVEGRSVDKIQDSYSMIDLDRKRRTMDYTADPIDGFDAAVRRESSAKVLVKPTSYLGYAASAAHVAYVSPTGHLALSAPSSQMTFVAPASHVAHVSPDGHLAYSAPAFQKAHASSGINVAYASSAAHAAYFSPLTETI